MIKIEQDKEKWLVDQRIKYSVRNDQFKEDTSVLYIAHRGSCYINKGAQATYTVEQ